MRQTANTTLLTGLYRLQPGLVLVVVLALVAMFPGAGAVSGAVFWQAGKADMPGMPCHHHHAHASAASQNDTVVDIAAHQSAAHYQAGVPDSLCCPDKPHSHSPAVLRLGRDNQLAMRSVIRDRALVSSDVLAPVQLLPAAAFTPDMCVGQRTGFQSSSACFTRYIRLLI